MSLEIVSLRQRPDLISAVFADELDAVWPDYMKHDAAARLYFERPAFDRYHDYAFAGLIGGKAGASSRSPPAP
jgi:hypothetical protein